MLPTVASQLDTLYLCPPAHLAQLKDYCAHRTDWFTAIKTYHNIPDTVGLDATADEVAKALLLRLMHGGSYKAWAEEFGVADKGASYGRGLNRVQALQRELCLARTATVD